jgi:hypothetical protein
MQLVFPCSRLDRSKCQSELACSSPHLAKSQSWSKSGRRSNRTSKKKRSLRPSSASTSRHEYGLRPDSQSLYRVQYQSRLSWRVFGRSSGRILTAQPAARRRSQSVQRAASNQGWKCDRRATGCAGKDWTDRPQCSWPAKVVRYRVDRSRLHDARDHEQHWPSHIKNGRTLHAIRITEEAGGCGNHAAGKKKTSRKRLMSR